MAFCKITINALDRKRVRKLFEELDKDQPTFEFCEFSHLLYSNFVIMGDKDLIQITRDSIAEAFKCM